MVPAECYLQLTLKSVGYSAMTKKKDFCRSSAALSPHIAARMRAICFSAAAPQ
jgi:hypothetical protein